MGYRAIEIAIMVEEVEDGLKIDCMDKTDDSCNTGRAPGEEEDAQGPRQEENHIHSPLRERHHDRRQEEGKPRHPPLSLDPRQFNHLLVPR
jgi:hypothetical protein